MDVQEPTFAARAVWGHKLLELKDRLEGQDWIEGASQFFVAIKSNTPARETYEDEGDVCRVVVEEGRFQVDLVLMDGHHRLRALKDLMHKD